MSKYLCQIRLDYNKREHEELRDYGGDEDGEFINNNTTIKIAKMRKNGYHTVFDIHMNEDGDVDDGLIACESLMKDIIFYIRREYHITIMHSAKAISHMLNEN